MILAAVLLALIGSADIARSGLVPDARRSARVGVAVLVAAAWAVLLGLAATGLGVPLPWLTLPLGLAVGWVVSTAADAGARPAGSPAVAPSRHPRLRILPAVAVLVVLAASVFWNPLDEPAGYLVDGLAQSPVRVVAGLGIETVVLGAGILLFLIESANIVVRSALRPALFDGVAEAAAGPVADNGAQTLELRTSFPWRTRVVVRSSEGTAGGAVPTVADLRGGRLIGPLERLLIVALSLVGALPIVAGLLAAKGIVRFPEISNDKAGGSKAEYFLVGSFVSWALALLGAGALWLSAHS
ncbi:hypothetical protein NVV95_10395 [Herbiconiux sp. CPCC 205716]|uniref:Uncharacterized protein n=1 Tax=Herbiconiux gentiana TaxID=2970912 RepID=A0ABT2GJK8_9MICO|nr:hypothetical protein [Herbiconiux gentiana]MCS5714961.1 hypothetical protein [Herbiconiux gentiana]